jgi:hypothetical protein
VKIYSHTQAGKLIHWIMILTLFLFLAAMASVRIWAQPFHVLLIVSMSFLFLIACWVLFGSLTVEISTTSMTVRFGPGLIKKSFKLGEIEEAAVVRNKWWYGWGIRLTPHGWMYNVSGLNAVELDLRGGKKFRIGTDEPEKLQAAIRSATGR